MPQSTKLSFSNYKTNINEVFESWHPRLCLPQSPNLAETQKDMAARLALAAER